MSVLRACLFALCLSALPAGQALASSQTDNLCAQLDAKKIAADLGFRGEARAEADGSHSCAITVTDAPEGRLDIGFVFYPDAASAAPEFADTGFPGIQSEPGLGDKAQWSSMGASRMSYRLRVLKDAVQIGLSYMGPAIPVSDEQAKHVLIAVAHSLLDRASEASADYARERQQVAADTAKACQVRGQREECPLPVNLLTAQPQSFEGEITAEHGGYYLTKAPKRSTLVVKTSGPKGIVNMIWCEKGEEPSETKAEIRLRLETSERCLVSVLIDAKAFQSFGPYRVTLSAE
ncbi:hypothetical protein [Labrys neptuniae]